MLHAMMMMMMMILITLIYCHFHYSYQDFESSFSKCCYFEFVPFCSYFL